MDEMNQFSNPQQSYAVPPQAQPQDPAFQQAFAPQYRAPVESPARSFFGTDRKGIVFALLLLCFSILCFNSFVYADHPGLGASIFSAAICVTTLAYLFNKRKTTTVYGVFCLFAYLAFAVSFAVTGSHIMLVVNAMFALSGVLYMEFMKQRKYDGFRAVLDYFRVAFALTFGRIHYGVFALFHRKNGDGTTQKRKSGGVLLGIAIALPFLVVIVPLLIQSDAAFENLLSSITFSKLFEILLSVFIGTFLFLLLFGRAVCISREERTPSEKTSERGMEPIIVVSFLSVIAAIYVVYLFSQLAYFINGFAGLLPKGYSVAEYARRGFFEMSVILAINLLIVFLANLVCRKNAEKTPRAVRLLSLFLCIFSLFLAATVLSKIYLYIQSFGMTRLRILTSLFTILLIVVFISVSVRLFRKKVPYMKIAMVTACLLLLFATYADTDRLIAAYNIRAYQSGKLDSIDMLTISELDSPTIVPYVFELLDDSDANVVDSAKAILSSHADQVLRIVNHDTPLVKGRMNTDWRAWNYAEQEAAALLEAKFDTYYIEKADRLIIVD